MKNRVMNMGIFLMLAIAAICCAEQNEYEGAIAIGIRSSALSKGVIDRIDITVSGAGIDPEIVVSLANDPTKGWSGMIEGIPSGNHCAFLAEAFDVESNLIYTGSATGVEIVAGQTAQAIIILQEVNPTEGFANSVPRFKSIVFSERQVAPEGTLEIEAKAIDPDQEELDYGWTVDGGAFDSSSVPSVIWTAPALEGSYTFKVTATDSQGASTTVSFDIEVVHGSGNAEVLIEVNTLPEVLSLIPTPSRIDVGEKTQLDLSATDADGDTLTYSWTADCVGSFNDPKIEDPTFTLHEDNDDADCSLSVIVRDDQGGMNSATIALATGPEVVPGPRIDENIDILSSVAAGSYHSCALRPDGTVACWGLGTTDAACDTDNGQRECGQAMPPEGLFVAIAASAYHSCGLTTEGNVLCWGSDRFGVTTPPEGKFTAISTGEFHNCALDEAGAAICWGSKAYGISTPPEGPFTAISSGLWHTCGLRLDGSVECWGIGEGESLNKGQTAAPEGEFIAIASGDYHSCAITIEGSAICWGDDATGQATPVNENYKSISAGDFHTCAITTNDRAVCWGSDTWGKSSPPEEEFVAVSVGDVHNCGRTIQNEVRCWGSDRYGESTPPEGM